MTAIILWMIELTCTCMPCFLRYCRNNVSFVCSYMFVFKVGHSSSEQSDCMIQDHLHFDQSFLKSHFTWSHIISELNPLTMFQWTRECRSQLLTQLPQTLHHKCQTSLKCPAQLQGSCSIHGQLRPSHLKKSSVLSLLLTFSRCYASFPSHTHFE